MGRESRISLLMNTFYKAIEGFKLQELKAIGIKYFLLMAFCFAALFSSLAFAATEEEVAIMAYASMAAYEGEENKLAGKELEKRGYTGEGVVIGENNAYIASREERDGTHFVVAIVGTESVEGVIKNLENSLTPFLGDSHRKVHRGYDMIAQSFAEDIAIRRMLWALAENSDNRLTITGHSLGGAVATVLGMTLVEKGLIKNEQLEVVTFGAPLMGDRAFLTDTKKLQLYAYEMKGDYVPSIWQIVEKKYKGVNPNAEQWESALRKKGSSHSINFYLAEAELQAILSKEENPLPSGREIYVAYPSMTDNTGLTEEVKQAFRKGLGGRIQSELGEISGFSYQAETVGEALTRAKEAGYEKMVYTTIDTVSRRTIKGRRGYYMTVTLTLYEVSSGTVLGSSLYCGHDGENLLLPKLLHMIHTLLPQKLSA